ncbi:uncharacterized protein si:ch1073-357b18.4 [Betta splendens]|uniref:Uncharacterized protein si:ch1073-357b18.4 n=1 Tax=Betta splendens TaxID=158456 RepID=A0A6P7N8I9_BETSP|nr:uncharacterized protein si:ch1073-357b18.4 [Betta splendens]
MAGRAQRGSGDVAVAHVKTEAADESTPALVLGSHESPAPCRDTACGGGGAPSAEEQADAELQAAATTAPVLLYPVSSERFFTAAADGKAYLTMAPAAAMPPAPSDQAFPPASDFSSKAVLCLIEAVGRRWGLYETRERSQLFQSVQEEMASKGHVLPVEKIRRKWNNLIVTYKRVKDRSRETGHAKTSWEFFDLMDATLCDTVGSHVVNNKRIRGGGAAPALTSPPAKVAAKAQAHRTNAGLSGAGVGVGVGGHGAASHTTATSSSELRPLVVNGDAGATLHPPSPSLMAPPCLTEPPSSPAPFDSASTSTADPHASRYAGHDAAPFLLNVASHGSRKGLLGPAQSFPAAFSCLASPGAGAASSPAPNPKAGEPSGPLQELLLRQEEQALLESTARHRAEAREKRRERRELRMAESLGRIATALELLSSKQDTVIALLQRLADRTK